MRVAVTPWCSIMTQKSLRRVSHAASTKALAMLKPSSAQYTCLRGTLPKARHQGLHERTRVWSLQIANRAWIITVWQSGPSLMLRLTSPKTKADPHPTRTPEANPISTCA